VDGSEDPPHWERFLGIGGPVAVRDGTLYAMGRETPRSSEDATGRGYTVLRAFDATSGEQRRVDDDTGETEPWSWPDDVETRDDLDGSETTLAVGDEQVFAMDEGVLTVVDAETGGSAWQRRLSGTEPFAVTDRALIGASNSRGEFSTVQRLQLDEETVSDLDVNLDGPATACRIAGEWAFVSTQDGYLYGITGDG